MDISAENRRGGFVEGLGDTRLSSWLLGERSCGQTKKEETQRLQERRRAWSHATSYRTRRSWNQF